MTITLSTSWIDPSGPDCTKAQLLERIRAFRTAPPAYTPDVIDRIVSVGLEVAAEARGRASAGFAQSFHETAGYRYGGQVQPGQLNFGGLGADNSGVSGGAFPSVWHGWMAFWAHHMNYWWGPFGNWPSFAEPFIEHAFRHRNVMDAGYGGIIQTIGDYTNGRWAWSPQYPKGTLQNGYAQAIVTGANAILSLPRGDVSPPPPSGAQIPGFQWFPARDTHFTKGRTQRIRGGAQHYTAGTNSLAWLTSTSGASDPSKRVSSTVLIKANPTLLDRGWQLVNLEDTAWTTAFANPYTASSEYEHTGTGTIPDIAYEVMSQTWVDIDRETKQRNLGSIDIVRGHNEWVGNPNLICPDGIDVRRVQRRFEELLAGDRDPRILVHGNPFGEFGYQLGFRGWLEKLGAHLYPQNPEAGALAIAGWALEDEWRGVDGASYQRTELGVLKWTPGLPAPWDVRWKRYDDPLPKRSSE
jgi:hypothetical protein